MSIKNKSELIRSYKLLDFIKNTVLYSTTGIDEISVRIQDGILEFLAQHDYLGNEYVELNVNYAHDCKATQNHIFKLQADLDMTRAELNLLIKTTADNSEANMFYINKLIGDTKKQLLEKDILIAQLQESK